MDKPQHITIVGFDSAGLSAAVMEKIQARNPTIDIVIIPERQPIPIPIHSNPIKITRLPDLKEPLIDPNTPIFNQKKHDQTCAKNRKKRKKKKK